MKKPLLLDDYFKGNPLYEMDKLFEFIDDNLDEGEQWGNFLKNVSDCRQYPDPPGLCYALTVEISYPEDFLKELNAVQCKLNKRKTFVRCEWSDNASKQVKLSPEEVRWHLDRLEILQKVFQEAAKSKRTIKLRLPTY